MPLHVAIFIGAATAVALFLRKAARPELVEYDMGSSGQLNELKSGEARTSPAISIVHVEGELFFGAAELAASRRGTAYAVSSEEPCPLASPTASLHE